MNTITFTILEGEKIKYWAWFDLPYSVETGKDLPVRFNRTDKSLPYGNAENVFGYMHVKFDNYDDVEFIKSELVKVFTDKL